MSQASLFEVEPVVEAESAESAEDKAPDFLSIAARKRAGLPDSFRWMQVEVIDRKIPNSDFLLHMAEPVGVYASGKRKGETKWPALKDCRRVVVSPAELRQAESAWEAEHGKCHCCGGAKVVGKQTCWVCKGSGLPKVAK